jgi:adenylyltransferase/sulfurtransferase
LNSSVLIINPRLSITNQELSRYHRHILLPEIGIKGQKKLKNAKVLVIGCGGLGCPVLQYLSAAGIGNLDIVDFDVVEESNLQRQVLFSTEDIGKPKAISAQAKLSKYNPLISINVFMQRLDVSNALELIKHYQLIVDCSDNFKTRYLINDACVILGKPLVSGSIYKFEGQVTVFNYKNGPTYRCLYPEPPEEKFVSNCAETGVIGTLTGLTGTLMANEVIKIITGIGSVLSGKLLTFDILTTRFQTFSYNLNPKNKEIRVLASDYNDSCSDIVRDITAKELRQKLSKNEPLQIIDVREPVEFQERNIGGILIPLRTLEKNLDKIPKDIPSVVVCRSGVRSLLAAQILIKNKFNNVYNLKGGLLDY